VSGQPYGEIDLDVSDFEDLQQAAGSTTPTWVTRGGERVSLMIPAPTVQTIQNTIQAVGLLAGSAARVPPYQEASGGGHRHGLDQSVRHHDHPRGWEPHTHNAGDEAVPL